MFLKDAASSTCDNPKPLTKYGQRFGKLLGAGMNTKVASCVGQRKGAMVRPWKAIAVWEMGEEGALPAL